MEIIAFILLVGLWAAFVLPPVMNSGKEYAVEDTPQRTVRQEAAPRTMPARRPATSRSQREQVLARRRMALIGLGALAALTLIVAIVTGSWALLVVNLIADVALAAYIAILLQIKQQQGGIEYAPAAEYEERKVRVVGG